MVFYGLLLFLIVEYVRPASYVPALNILRLNALLPLGVVIGSCLPGRTVDNGTIIRDPNAPLIGCFIGLIAVSVVVSDVRTYAYNVLTVVLGYVLISWAICRQVTDRRRINQICATMVLIHIVVAALNPVMFTDPDGRHAITSGSFLGDGNDFALSVNLAIPLAAYLVFESKRVIFRLASVGALLGLVLSVVATKSRGGTVALGCVAVYYWLKTDRKVVTGALAAVAVVAVMAMAPESYFNRMRSITDSQEGSAQGRIHAWTAAVNMAIDHPVFGVGAGAFPFSYARYRPSNASTMVGVMTAHSNYFLVLGELGFPGLLLLLTFIITNLVSNRRVVLELRRSQAPGADDAIRLLNATSASMIAFASGGAFLSAIYYPHTFVIAGVLSAARHLARNQAAMVAQPAPPAAVPVGPPRPGRGPAAPPVGYNRPARELRRR